MLAGPTKPILYGSSGSKKLNYDTLAMPGFFMPNQGGFIVNKQNESDDDMLTPEEVCKLIGGITTKTLRDWNITHRHKQLLAPIRFTHKVVRYERRNVMAFIAKCRSTY